MRITVTIITTTTTVTIVVVVVSIISIIFIIFIIVAIIILYSEFRERDPTMQLALDSVQFLVRWECCA